MQNLYLEVATKFSTNSGIIIQFNTPNKPGFDFLRAFDCSFISRYKEEDERYTVCKQFIYLCTYSICLQKVLKTQTKT